MTEFSLASDFQLRSVDHDSQELLSTEVHSIRNLLGSSGSAYNTPEQLEFSFKHEDKQYDFELFREAGPISKDVRITRADGSVEYGLPVDQQHSVYYSADRRTMLTFSNEGKFDGLVMNESIHFTSEKGELKVYTDFEGLPFGRKLKAVEHWDNCHSAQSQGLMHANFGGAMGSAFQNRYGGNALSTFSSMISLTNGVYSAQMDIAFEVKEMYYASDSDSFSSSSCSMTIDDQFYSFRDWSGRPSNQAVWHLVDHCFGSQGSVSGVGYVGTLCVDRWNVGVTYTADFYLGWLTMAHELGHNFNAQHSFEEGQGRTGGIMDYGDGRYNGEYQFNTQYRKTEMCNYIQSKQSCSHFVKGAGRNADPPSLEIDFNARELDCVKTRNRAVKIEEESLGKSARAVNLEECKAACFTKENCRTFTFNEKTGFCDLFGEKTEGNLYHLANFDTYFCSESGAEALRLAPTEDDKLGALAKEEIESLEETCCASKAGALYPGMNYMFLEGVGEAACKEICLRESECTAVGFEKEANNCIFWNTELEKSVVSKSDSMDLLMCDRGCIAGHVGSTYNGSELEQASGSVAATGVAVLVGLLAVGVTKFMKGSN